MAMQATFNPETGESDFSNLGNGGNTISSEDLGQMNESNGRFEFQQLEYSDPSFREQYSDNDNALFEVDQFALDAAFALAGGEGLVREAIATAEQWMDPASIETYNEKIDELVGAGEYSALEDLFSSLVAQYMEARGVTKSEGFADDAFGPDEQGEYEDSASDDRDFTNPHFEQQAEEFVSNLSQDDVHAALDLWDATPREGAERAIEYASQFPANHPIHLTSQALAHLVTSNEHPRQVLMDLIDIVGENVAMTSFAHILEAIN